MCMDSPESEVCETKISLLSFVILRKDLLITCVDIGKIRGFPIVRYRKSLTVVDINIFIRR